MTSNSNQIRARCTHVRELATPRSRPCFKSSATLSEREGYFSDRYREAI